MRAAARDDGHGAPTSDARQAGSTTSNEVVISAVLPSMIEAEQYFSWLRAMARSTAAAGTALPVTVKCMWMRVNTLGSRGALAGQAHAAAAHVVAAALQDQHHVVGGAAAGAGQHGFHRARRQVLPALPGVGHVGRAIHGHDVAAAGLGHKAHARARARRAGPADWHSTMFDLSEDRRPV
jgi:hypothetical protein